MDTTKVAFVGSGITLGISLGLLIDFVRPIVNDHDVRALRVSGCWESVPDRARFDVSVETDGMTRIRVQGFDEELFLYGRGIVRDQERQIMLFGELSEDGEKIERSVNGTPTTIFVRVKRGPC